MCGIDAPVHGSLLGTSLTAPAVGIASDDATGGYWVVTADGVVHGFDAPTEHHTGGADVTANTIGIASVRVPTSGRL